MPPFSRRLLLKNGAVALAALGGWGPQFLRSAALAAPQAAAKGKILVCIFQRGAADGLSMAAPFGDPDYYKLRNEIALPRPKAGDAEASIDLDGFFALHRGLAPLAPLFKSKELAVIHAVGSPNPTRSHFDAQDFMEAGVLKEKATPTGWLSRAVRAGEKPAKLTPFRAVAMTAAVPRSLAGDPDVLAIPDLRSFGVRGASPTVATGATPTAGGGFEGLYDSAVDEVLGGAGRESFDALRILKEADIARYQPEHGANYPGDQLGKALMQVAQLVKADVGLQVAFAEAGGWDTHANQGAANGQLAGRLTDFAKSLAAFHQDLGDRMEDVVVLTMTEFGRSVRQNGTKGTDHGHAACFLAMGGPVNGGKVLGDWPGLAHEQLFEGRDLAMTTDYRDVLAEVARKHLCVRDLPSVFPHFDIQPSNERGVLRA